MDMGGTVTGSGCGKNRNNDWWKSWGATGTMTIRMVMDINDMVYNNDLKDV